MASLYVEVFATYDLRLNVVGVLVGAVVVVVVLCSFLGCAVLGPCWGVSARFFGAGRGGRGYHNRRKEPCRSALVYTSTTVVNECDAGAMEYHCCVSCCCCCCSRINSSSKSSLWSQKVLKHKIGRSEKRKPLKKNQNSGGEARCFPPYRTRDEEGARTNEKLVCKLNDHRHRYRLNCSVRVLPCPHN